MRKNLKEQLKNAFDAPVPTRKAKFLQSINFPKANLLDFILAQIGYIRKRVWIISGLLVIVSLFALSFTADDGSLSLIWVISSILPIISLVIVTEVAKSASYNMAELEMSCKYNLAGVMLTRLGILSCFNILIFGVIIAAFMSKADYSLFRAVIYMLAPFMLTCSLSVFTLNRLRSRETIYICGGISGFVSIANALFTSQYKAAFSDEYMKIWILAFIILSLFTVMESIKLIKKTEELQQWNLL